MPTLDQFIDDLASHAPDEGATLVGVAGSGTVQSALDQRGFRALNPLDAGIVLTDPASVRSTLNSIFSEASAGGAVAIAKGDYSVALPTIPLNNLDLRLDGTLINTNTTDHVSLLSSPIALGVAIPAYLSDWTAGTPTRRYWGSFVKAIYSTWNQLKLETGTAGAVAQAIATTGSDPDGVGPLTSEQHIDPVTGATVSNSGLYRWSTAPAGWERIGDAGAHFILDDATIVKGTYAQPAQKTITGASEGAPVGGGGGKLIRITSPSHGLITGTKVTIAGVTGTTEANGTWTITVPLQSGEPDPNNFDLQGSMFTNAYALPNNGTITVHLTTTGDQLSINGTTVTLTGVTVAQAVSAINGAAITGVTASDYDGFLRIDRVGGTLTLADVTGTPLAALGLTAGTYTNNADDALARFAPGPGNTNGDLVIFQSREGDLVPIGTDAVIPNGTGGVQHRAARLDKLYVTAENTSPIKRFTFDRTPQDFTQGSICASADAAVTEPSGAAIGLSYNFLVNASITGNGGISNDVSGLWAKSGTHQLYLDIASTTGAYGFGGNGHSDGIVRIRKPTAREKAADIANASTRMWYWWHDLVCEGTSPGGQDAAFVFNEYSSLIKAEGMTVRWPNLTSNIGVKWSNASDSVFDVMLLDLPKQAAGYAIQVGLAKTRATPDIGGVYGVERTETRVRRLRGLSELYLVNFVYNTSPGTANRNNDNWVHVGYATARPTLGAAYLDGIRNKITGKYQYGDVVIASTAVDCFVDVQLHEGIVRGQTDANARFVRVNGNRQYPGAIYNPIDETVGAVIPVPNCRTGQTGETDFEHRFLYHAATGATVAAPAGTPLDGQTLTINIKNTSNSAMTLAFNAAYEGLPALANIAAGSRTIATFRYSGAWRLVALVENSTALGPIIYTTDFSSDARWIVDPDCTIDTVTGQLKVVAAADGAARPNTVSVARLTAGARYQTTTVVDDHNGGGVNVLVGGTVASAFSTDGTKVLEVVAGSEKTVGLRPNTAASSGWAMSSFEVREL